MRNLSKHEGYVVIDDIKESDYSITEICPHNIVYLKLISTVATCETTVEVCEVCGKILTKPETDCR
jgi:hypothetical protein